MKKQVAGPAIHWFRIDLRLDDNPSLNCAAANPAGIIPVFIWHPEDEGSWPPGAASKWWLHESLRSLDQSLQAKGLELIVRSAETVSSILDVAGKSGAVQVCFNRRYEPSQRKLEERLEKALGEHGIECTAFDGSVLKSPAGVLNKQGKPYQVYTPFSKNYMGLLEPFDACAVPKTTAAPDLKLESVPIPELGLMPAVDWYGGMAECWQPGEQGAKRALARFAGKGVQRYASERDVPGTDSTSSLSPHLHFGEISPRRVWNKVVERLDEVGDSAQKYLRQLVWREFGCSMLYHFPFTQDAPLREAFKAFPWRRNKRTLAAWQRGQTGYPIVDAGMRQLWSSGWMHNRVRMIAASFLVKDLLIPWNDGAEWFWDTLVDADLANNTLGWQWTAGCGPDAAPFFRVFNPMLQGEKFDPAGAYVRKWVPELSELPDRWIHRPWEAPKEVLARANLVMGKTYPKPIVDHAEARDRALEAYDRIVKPS